MFAACFPSHFCCPFKHYCFHCAYHDVKRNTSSLINRASDGPLRAFQMLRPIHREKTLGSFALFVAEFSLWLFRTRIAFRKPSSIRHWSLLCNSPITAITSSLILCSFYHGYNFERNERETAGFKNTNRTRYT